MLNENQNKPTLNDLIRYVSVKWERHPESDLEEIIEELYPQFKQVLKKRLYISQLVELFLQGSNEYVIECLDNNANAKLYNYVVKAFRQNNLM